MPEQTITAKFEADISNFQANMRALQASARELRSSVSEMSDALSLSSIGMEKASSSATKAASAKRDMGRASHESRQGLMAMIGGVSQAIEEISELAGMAVELVVALGQQRDAVVQAQRGFQMLGMSVSEAKKQMDDLAKTSVSKAFGPQTVNEIILLAGRLGKDIKVATTEVQALGNALAAAGGKAEALKPIWEKMQEIQQKTKVTKEDIDELAFMGINSWQMLSDASGKSVQTIQREVSQGAMTGKKAYQDLMEGAAQSTKGAEMASSDFGSSLGRLGEVAGRALTPLIDGITRILDLLVKLEEEWKVFSSMNSTLMFMTGFTTVPTLFDLGTKMFGGGQGHASGIVDNPVGHGGWVGEDGPEFMWIPERATIFPNGMSPFEQRSSSSGSMLPALSSLSAITPLQGHSGPVTFQVYLDSRMIAEATAPHLASVIRAFSGRRR